MRRKEGIAALNAGAMIVLALMAVFAVELSANQSQSRTALESTAHQRAVLVGGLLDTVFQATSQPSAAVLAAYGTPTVSNRLLQRNRGANMYLALLDSGGRVLAHSAGFTAQAAATIAAPSAVSQIQHGRPWALGNVRPYGKLGVINFATRLRTKAGPRILMTGFSPQALEAFTASELHKIPGVQGHHTLLLDGDGVVLASTDPQRPAGYVFHTPTQLETLSHGSGTVKNRYFDQVPLTNTTWKIILSAPAGDFFASVSGPRHYLPWVIFVAFGLVAFASLLLVRRSFRDADRVTAINDKLIGANVELADAKLSLEDVNGALEDSNRALARSNEELERQASELVRSNTELDQFASIASHDLQEPLRKVRTFTERITETEAGVLSERGLDYLRRANSSAERMQTLIEDLLRYSRVSTHARPFTAVDLNTIAADVLEDLSDQINRSGALVRAGKLPTINADAPQMRQLVQNLVSNAVKFRREDVTCEVDVSATHEPGWVTLSVSDNGIGFDPQYSQRIFRVFERLHGRGTYPGTGIGLALCRKIAERHGGTIVARSVPDEGSTFTVTMQTQRTEAVSDAPRSDDVSPGSATTKEPFVAA
ncbi:MAG: sensor histidine kinase [Solirubrobacteraceae bacterium]